MILIKYILVLFGAFLISSCEGNSQLDQKDDNAYELVENLDSAMPDSESELKADGQDEMQTSEGQLVRVSTEKIIKSETLNYQKPGAAVQFSHNYDGVSEQNEEEIVTLRFNHQYKAGTISISLEPQDGLIVADNSSPYVFSLADSSELEMHTTLSADTEGKYYLSIFATVDDLNSNPISRVFALAVNVGDPEQIAKKSLEPVDMAVKKTASGEQIILMPAEETISQQ